MSAMILAIAETAQQAALAEKRHPAATIVALTPETDHWREVNDRTDPTIEDICDERVIGALGPEITGLLEALSDRVARLSAPMFAGFDPHGDLSLRAYFHYLRTHIDGVIIRMEQVLAAVDALRPAKVIIFDDGVWRMTGITCLDKPALGLTQRLLERVARARGLDVETIPIPSTIAARMAQADEAKTSSIEPTVSKKAAAAPPLAVVAAPVGRNLLNSVGDLLARLQRRIKSALEGAVAAATPAKPMADPALQVRKPTLVLSLFSELGTEVATRWKADGGVVLSIGEIPADPRRNAQADEMRMRCSRLWEAVRSDPEVGRRLNWRGVDLRSEVFAQIEPIICEHFPARWADAGRFDSWFAEQRAVVLLGGLVDQHYVLARAAGRHHSPVVSYHIGGFLGFSLLPIHERYDLAEADCFICGGAMARETFEAPGPEARWPEGVRRAQPVPLGAPWISDLVRRYRSTSAQPRPVRRVMVVLNALLGDCRYIGRVFPPEIDYWRFTRRLIERLASEPIEVILKPPLPGRYPQSLNPIEGWVEEGRFANVTMLRDVPLAECLDEADAFIVESPSTPLPQIVATRAAVLLYVDKDVYKLVPAARQFLARRCAVLAESEDSFFAGLESWLADVRNDAARCGEQPDDSFLENFCTGSGPPADVAHLVSFLQMLLSEHPLNSADLANLRRFREHGAVARELDAV